MTALWILTFPMSAERALAGAHIYRVATARSQKIPDVYSRYRREYSWSIRWSILRFLPRKVREDTEGHPRRTTRQSRGNGAAFENSWSGCPSARKRRRRRPLLFSRVVRRVATQQPEVNSRKAAMRIRTGDPRTYAPHPVAQDFVAARKHRCSRWGCRSTAAWMLPGTCDSPNIRHKHRAAVVRGRAAGEGKGWTGSSYLGERERESGKAG